MATTTGAAPKEKRATRIDKDVKTTRKYGRVLSLLYDVMWSYRYFPLLAALLLVGEAVAGGPHHPARALDRLEGIYAAGVAVQGRRARTTSRCAATRDRSCTPRGFLYVFSVLHSVTDNGENIRRAQYIFLGFYLVTIATVLAIYYRARVLPPWAPCSSVSPSDCTRFTCCASSTTVSP
ncbi:hypothetical protein PINS_up018931 [Pythium insidiosum]|nr:hypothetical protein PINS_up018931 [Pythium insidiosum]